MSKVTHFKELKVWQKGMALTREVYKLTAQFPPEERYGLTGQMRRAAVSVPSNIAEGQARRGTKDFLVFLSHTAGSLAELETQAILAEQLGFSRDGDQDQVRELIHELQKMLARLRDRLQARL